jgi:nucleotide-binding universal stress UspA family protein
MKPKISLKPGRPVLELRRPNVRDEVSAIAGEIRSASKNGVGLPPPFFGLNKILVPIDFSNLSEKLFRYAVQLAQDGRIIFFHVVETRPRRKRQSKVNDTNGNRMDDAERKLLTLGEHEFGPSLKFDVLVQSGKPYREVVNAAKALSVDLIVMGTGGATKRHSSTAERVVRYAPCPVLVVHEKEPRLFWGIASRQPRQHFSQRLRRREVKSLC